MHFVLYTPLVIVVSMIVFIVLCTGASTLLNYCELHVDVHMYMYNVMYNILYIHVCIVFQSY